MQVLVKSKVKFVLAVVFCLLTSFWICLWFLTALGIFVLLLKKIKNKMPPDDFKPAKPVLQIFQDPAGRGGLGSVFCDSQR